MSALCSPLASIQVNPLSGTQQRSSRMLVLTFMNVPESTSVSYMVRLVVTYLQTIFMEVDEYVTKRDDDYYMIYFPKIVVSSDPIYMTICHDLGAIFERNSITIKRSNIGIDISPTQVSEEEGIPQLSQGDIEISASDIRACEDLSPSNNTLLNNIDHFHILLLFIEKIVERDPSFITQYILYISSAYYRSEKVKSYNNREDLVVSRDKWTNIMKTLGVDQDTATKYFDNAKRYSYTTITLEEIIRRQSPEMRQLIDQYREARIKQKIRVLFNFVRFPNDPSDNELWKAFSEYIRKDHFFADGSIYVLDENYCRKVVPSEMREVINTFVTYVNEVKVSIKNDLIESDKSADIEKLNLRYQRIIRQFESKTSAKFVADSIENYNHTKLRNEVQSKAIPFEDMVVIYDNNQIFMRKAFMEDQFTGCAGVPIMGFGKLQSEQTALEEVNKALKQIFVYDENVHFFIKWCGSLLTHKPERCCLFMYGPKGGNAKTTLANVLLTIFGAWAVQCRPDMLAPNGKSSSCTPFDMELENKVIAVFSEPQKGIKYSSSALKELTGGDRKKGAAKYKDPREFDQTAKIMILLNQMLELDEVDPAMIDRVFILKCIGRYMRNATPDQAENHIYPRDDSFWKDMIRIRAMAHIIVHVGLPAYMEEGLKKTQKMEEELHHWRKEVCPFTRFLDYTQEFFEGKRKYTGSRQVYARFRFYNPSFSQSYDDFVARFKETTGKSTVNMGKEEYYPFYVPNCQEYLALP